MSMRLSSSTCFWRKLYILTLGQDALQTIKVRIRGWKEDSSLINGYHQGTGSKCSRNTTSDHCHLFHQPNVCKLFSMCRPQVFQSGFSGTVQKFQIHSCSAVSTGHIHRCITPVSFTWLLVPDIASCHLSSRCYSSRTSTRKRIPLSQVEEIEAVLAESREVILEFAEVLGCSEAAMTDMVRRDTRLVTHFFKESVMDKMKLLLDHGFTAEEILSRYQVFSRSIYGLQSRLAAMESVRHYRHGLAMLLLSDIEFASRMARYRREVEVMGRHPSQASFVAELLECTADEVVSLANQKHNDFLLTLPPSRLQEMVNLLHSYGVSLSEMREKCLMLRCAPDLARQRLEKVHKAGVFKPRLVLFILTNSDDHFTARFATWVRNAEALGGHVNELDFLMDRLKCSERDLASMMSKKPHVARMKGSKLKKCLDVLQNDIGLSSLTILQHGDLLHYRPKRLLSRWLILQPLSLSEHDLVKQLVLSERKFVAKYGYGSG